MALSCVACLQVAALQTQVTTLTAQVETVTQARNRAIQQANELNKKLDDVRVLVFVVVS